MKNLPAQYIGGILGLLAGILLFFQNCWGLFNCVAGAEGASCGNPMACTQNSILITAALVILGFLIGWVYIRISKK
jgi:hypothetical protein